MEISLEIYVNDEGIICLKSSAEKEYKFVEMTISANEIYALLNYEIGNKYKLAELKIDSEKYSKQYKIAKPFYDMIQNLINQINDLTIADDKTDIIELEDDNKSI